jgi:hypothetical protein
MKVLRSMYRSSRAPTRLKTASTIPSFALSAGTKLPACAKIAMIAIWRRRVLLPAMFGPVIMARCRSAFRLNEFGVKFRADWPDNRPNSTVGWRPLTISNVSLRNVQQDKLSRLRQTHSAYDSPVIHVWPDEAQLVCDLRKA